MATVPLSRANWEEFDAEGLFPPPQLHTNKITKIDRKDLKKADSEDQGDQMESSSEESGEPQDGDTYTDGSPDTGHVDELFEMEGLDGGTPDERELRADKEEDQRTEPEQSDAKSDEDEAKDGKDPQDQKEAPEADEAEGAEKPIQKESEGVEEVAEATSKTSEDVHGGDEATKDIEDSPNAADDGQNPDNHGAESGEGGEDGEGQEGEGSADAEGESPAGGGSGGGMESSEADGSDTEGDADGDPLAKEDWEDAADHSATALQLMNTLEELEAKVRNEKGHDTTLPSYQFDREASPVELEIAFHKGRELIQKLAAEEDFTARVSGPARWDAKALVREVVSYRHPRIPSARYQRPREADIVILLDISGSCAQQAEMFMAIAAGAVGAGVRIYVGYNGSCRAAAMEPPSRLPRNYEQAKAWVQSEVNRVSGWHNAHIGEWRFREFVEEVRPKTCIIFGDWDGLNQYQEVAHDPKFRSTKFFWFANEGRRDVDSSPEGWSKKNYFPGVYGPRDLVKALRKLR